MDKKFIIISIIIISLIPLSGCLEVVTSEKYVQKFEIRPTCIKNCVLRDGNFTVPVLVNDSSLISWADPVISFQVWGLVPMGSSTEDYITLFFSVEDFNTQIFKYNGAYQISWAEGTNRWYVEGSKTMPFPTSYNFTLTFDVDIYELARSSVSDLSIHFRNKEGTWEKTYELTFLVVEV